MSQGGPSGYTVPYRVGKWYQLPVIQNNNNALTVAGRLYLAYAGDVARRVDQLAVIASGVVAGATVRIGYYADAGGVPDAGALICTTGDVDVSAGGVGSGAITGGALTLPQEKWGAVLIGATPSTLLARAFGAFAATTAPFDTPVTGNNGRSADPGAGALPGACPVTTFGGQPMPQIFARAA